MFNLQEKDKSWLVSWKGEIKHDYFVKNDDENDIFVKNDDEPCPHWPCLVQSGIADAKSFNSATLALF